MTLVLFVPPEGVAFPLNAQKVTVDSKPYMRARPDGVVDSRLLQLFTPTAGNSSGCTSCSVPAPRNDKGCSCGAMASSNLPCTCRASGVAAIAARR